LSLGVEHSTSFSASTYPYLVAFLFANFTIPSKAPDLSHAISEGADKEGSLDKAEGSRSQGGGGGSSWDKAGGGGWDSNKGGDAGW
jgi:hypothetical protein